MRSLLSALHELLFPSYCFYCGRHLEHSGVPLLCLQCLEQVKATASPCCTICGIPFGSGQDHICGSCLKKRPIYNQLRTALVYQEVVSSLLLRLKFSGQINVLPTLTWLVKQTGILAQFSQPDIIIPVPLHIVRLRERLFNQSLLLSRSCFRHWREKIQPDQLIRHVNTHPQSLLKSKERKTNLKGGFRLHKNHCLEGKRILLVDDVLTTGSTIDECAQVLSQARPLSIEVFVIARSIV